ncbi:MAG: hypothetical protein M9949_12740 [Candidatus Kapabacteria bacterium]|nr:hypothetical protein [Candidatus Kapabacteria bacterium]
MVKSTAKILLSITLVFAYLSGTNHYFVFYITFQLNHDFIIEQLCIERDNEINTCQGCCQQEKFMEQETENQFDDIAPVFPEHSLAIHLIKDDFQHIQLLVMSKLEHVENIYPLCQTIYSPESPPPEIS